MIPFSLLVNLAEFSEGEADCLHGVRVPSIHLGVHFQVHAVSGFVVGGTPNEILDGNLFSLRALGDGFFDGVCYWVVCGRVIHDVDTITGFLAGVKSFF